MFAKSGPFTLFPPPIKKKRNQWNFILNYDKMYLIHYICTKQRFHFITDQGRRLQSRVAVWRKRSRVFSSTRVEPSEEAKNFIRNLSSMFPLSPKKLQDITWPITQTRFHQNSCSFVDEKGLGRFSRLISPNNRSQDYHFAIACNSYSLKVLEQRQVFFARLLSGTIRQILRR